MIQWSPGCDDPDLSVFQGSSVPCTVGNHDVLKFRDLMKISEETVLSWGHEKVLKNWPGQREAKSVVY